MSDTLQIVIHIDKRALKTLLITVAVLVAVAVPVLVWAIPTPTPDPEGELSPFQPGELITADSVSDYFGKVAQRIGQRSQLTTAAKGTLVAAINEVDSSVGNVDGALANLAVAISALEAEQSALAARIATTTQTIITIPGLEEFRTSYTVVDFDRLPGMAGETRSFDVVHRGAHPNQKWQLNLGLDPANTFLLGPCPGGSTAFGSVTTLSYIKPAGVDVIFVANQAPSPGPCETHPLNGFSIVFY